MSLRSAADPNYARPLTRLIDPAAGPLDFAGYEAENGYAAFRRVLKDLTPAAVQALVDGSNLRGRGGAGFPTGVKWSLVPMSPDTGTKYLVCNADEMEPGTFKDRLLMEQAPHQLVEAMLIGGYAIQASAGYIFLRGEYVTAAQRLNRGDRRRARRRLHRREHPRRRLELRALRAYRRRSLHLRRRDRADQLSRGAPRDSAREAAVPADRRPLGTPDDRQQRRNAVEPAAHRRQRHGLVQGSVGRQEQRRRHQALRLFRSRGQAGLLGTADRHQRARDPRGACGRHADRAASSKRGCPAARRPTFCCRSTSTSRWTTRRSPRPVRVWAPA